MRILLGLSLAWLWPLAGCTPSPMPPPLPVRGGEPGIPAAHWPAIYFRGFDGVTAAAGLTPLRAARLANGREVRIWIGGGIGYPQRLYRFVDDGRRVQGEQVLYWPVGSLLTEPEERPGETFHDLMLYGQRGHCDKFRQAGSTGVCRTLFTRSPDWEVVLRRAEAAGLWTLPDASTLPNQRMVFDGWGITVELRDGPAYRTYHYGNPDRQAWPEAKQAVAIAEALEAIDSLARLPDVVKLYRGTTTGRYKAEFRPCEGGPAWEFQGDLRWLLRGVEAPAGIDTADVSREYFVEVLGELAPEWLVRQWKSAFPQVLQPLKIERIAPWSGVECAQKDAQSRGPA